MAPETLATPSQASKLRDIKRVDWAARTGIPSVRPGELKRSNGQPNRNPKANAFGEDVLRPFKLPGIDEESTDLYIADAWATLDYSAHEANEKTRRFIDGQGPREIIYGSIVDPKTKLVTPASRIVMSPTRKHWGRPARRAKNRIARAARKVNRRPK